MDIDTEKLNALLGKVVGDVGAAVVAGVSVASASSPPEHPSSGVSISQALATTREPTRENFMARIVSYPCSPLNQRRAGFHSGEVVTRGPSSITH